MLPVQFHLNLILTGFMGTGKTSIGRKIAETYQRPWLDTDDWIVQHTGKTIAQIFAQDGEEQFRIYEQQSCQIIPPAAGWVIATGGGTLLRPRCRELLATGSVIICLISEASIIQARLQNDRTRPLFQGNWQKLYQSRMPIYQSFHYNMDTSHLDIEQAANQVMEIYQTAQQQEKK